MPVSSSSPSSSIGDREIFAAAGALPESGGPLGSSGQQKQADDDASNVVRGELDGAPAAHLVTN